METYDVHTPGIKSVPFLSLPLSPPVTEMSTDAHIKWGLEMWDRLQSMCRAIDQMKHKFQQIGGRLTFKEVADYAKKNYEGGLASATPNGMERAVGAFISAIDNAIGLRSSHVWGETPPHVFMPNTRNVTFLWLSNPTVVLTVPMWSLQVLPEQVRAAYRRLEKKARQDKIATEKREELRRLQVRSRDLQRQLRYLVDRELVIFPDDMQKEILEEVGLTFNDR